MLFALIAIAVKAWPASGLLALSGAATFRRGSKTVDLSGEDARTIASGVDTVVSAVQGGPDTIIDAQLQFLPPPVTRLCAGSFPRTAPLTPNVCDDGASADAGRSVCLRLTE